jgi:hypothetical protein
LLHPLAEWLVSSGCCHLFLPLPADWSHPATGRVKSCVCLQPVQLCGHPLPGHILHTPGEPLTISQSAASQAVPLLISPYPPCTPCSRSCAASPLALRLMPCVPHWRPSKMPCLRSTGLCCMEQRCVYVRGGERRCLTSCIEAQCDTGLQLHHHHMYRASKYTAMVTYPAVAAALKHK